MPEILTQLNTVFRNVFHRPDLQVTAQSNASVIPGWDSLTHMDLISETEKCFGIRFSFDEMMSFQTVGDMMRCIEKHQQPRV